MKRKQYFISSISSNAELISESLYEILYEDLDSCEIENSQLCNDVTNYLDLSYRYLKKSDIYSEIEAKTDKLKTISISDISFPVHQKNIISLFYNKNAELYIVYNQGLNAFENYIKLPENSIFFIEKSESTVIFSKDKITIYLSVRLQNKENENHFRVETREIKLNCSLPVNIAKQVIAIVKSPKRKAPGLQGFFYF